VEREGSGGERDALLHWIWRMKAPGVLSVCEIVRSFLYVCSFVCVLH